MLGAIATPVRRAPEFSVLNMREVPVNRARQR